MATFINPACKIYDEYDFSKGAIVTFDPVKIAGIRSLMWFKNGDIKEIEDAVIESPEPITDTNPEANGTDPTIEEQIAILERDKPKGYGPKIARLRKKLEA